jgi:nitroreductase
MKIRIGVCEDAMSQEADEVKPASRISYPINPLIARRTSTRAFDAQRPVEREKLLTLLEAARWAPSSFNEQPWRYLVFDNAIPDLLESARACLSAGNAWARTAPVLLLSVAHNYLSHNGKPNRHAQHDVGLASQNLVLQAVELGLATAQIAGFDAERARKSFAIPESFMPMAMIAIGYPYQGSLADLPESLRQREQQPRQRKFLREITFSGIWDTPFE